LEKDRDLRFQSASEIRSELKRMKRDVSSGRVRLAESLSATGTNAVVRERAHQTETEASNAGIAELTSRTRRNIWVFAGIMLLAFVGAVLIYLRISSGNIVIPFQDVSIAKITDNGKVARAAMSRDGRYVGWVLREGATRSLWVRQVATGSNVQI